MVLFFGCFDSGVIFLETEKLWLPPLGKENEKVIVLDFLELTVESEPDDSE